MGWDVYDGLNSNFLKVIPCHNSPLIRLAWIQFFKRCPVNFRTFVCVSKGFNMKGLALFASGMIYLERYDEAEKLLRKLLNMKCDEKWGMSWGYNFPWQARAFFVPVGIPNMVASVFVANSFLDMFEATQNIKYLNIANECCDFILEHLTLFESDDLVCFGYIPGESARIHNANMLGAALLGRVFKHTGDKTLFEKSKKAFTYSMNAITNEFYWSYGERSHHSFIDNFHTGFNLVALKGWMDSTGETYWKDHMKKAYERYITSFWLDDGCPKYYHDRLYPIDIHCSAQGIITCLKLSDCSSQSIPQAKKIAGWAVANMQDKKGYFYYQKTRWYTNRIPYIRWSQAWMFYAMAAYLCSIEKNNHK